ncbi:putative branched-chain amino acid ABC transporter, permease protein [Bradyrhizobium sp. ORS 278]|uniref:branched-chain amino acid ABC transporter permease n=1 Tax=Bradyrhizobium sp. (strain ORS 278) TaxID=114615 RepID=UPI00015088F1|nr:branched-chain amino acid ABC transporter permease [Bradyrhizobium sp. ORS 278]CAL79516.1 putative branched-chain amino acid ABC transporter, permease protein [Bradyrhizobium sp. ORS 278]
MSRSVIAAVILAVLAILGTLLLGRFGAYLMHAVAIAAIGALSLNLLTGFCGQINFAQAGLLGVGAYTAGLAGNAGWDVLALPVAGLAAVVTAMLIGLPALRLRGLYFAIATLAAQFILEYLFKFAEPITHGVSGLLIRPMTVLGQPIQTDQGYAIVAIVLLLVTFLVMQWLRRTDLGRAFLVVRENEVVAKGMGINVARTKMLAFMISGFFAGVAGGLIGFTARLAHPESFGMSMSVDYVAMIIVGGLGSMSGAVLGAGFITLLPEAIQRLGEIVHISDLLSALREMAFGLLIIVFLIFEGRGLSAIGARLMSPRWLRKAGQVDRDKQGLQLQKIKSTQGGLE